MTRNLGAWWRNLNLASTGLADRCKRVALDPPTSTQESAGSNTMAPKNECVDVLVRTYNHAEFIEQTLSAILAQTSSVPVRIIVVDDGSQDSTVQILERIKSERPNRVLLHLGSHKGVRHPHLWTAWRQAKADYIAICDGDDVWVHNNKLQAQLDYLQSRPDLDVVGTLGVLFSDFKTFQEIHGSRATTDNHMSSLLVRRAAFETPFFRFAIIGFDVLCNYFVRESIGEVMIAVRRHPGSWTARYSDQKCARKRFKLRYLPAFVVYFAARRDWSATRITARQLVQEYKAFVRKCTPLGRSWRAFLVRLRAIHSRQRPGYFLAL
jgi:glycosyltransferase involved in cell wall biosynthesis